MTASGCGGIDGAAVDVMEAAVAVSVALVREY